MENQSPEFCTGVQILLKRMESNPEEFSGAGYGKWGHILQQVVTAKESGSDKLQQPNYLNGITAAEINALYASYSKFLRKKFDDKIMKELLNDAEELSYSMTSAPNVVLGHGGAGSSATVSIGAGAGAVSGAISAYQPYYKNNKQTVEEILEEVKGFL